jgi:hypothetical protein
MAMSDLVDNPTATGIATCTALGAFAGGSYAMLIGQDEQIERYAARWSVYGGMLGIALELSAHIARLIGPLRPIRSHS